jgi:hypothetical protein
LFNGIELASKKSKELDNVMCAASRAEILQIAKQYFNELEQSMYAKNIEQKYRQDKTRKFKQVEHEIKLKAEKNEFQIDDVAHEVKLKAEFQIDNDENNNFFIINNYIRILEESSLLLLQIPSMSNPSIFSVSGLSFYRARQQQSSHHREKLQNQDNRKYNKM